MKPDDPHLTVLVTGAPGAGKSSLARPLARKLGFALLSKDVIKERLYETLDGVPDDLACSRRTGGAAMELLWTLAAHCPRVVLDANFRPHSDYERARVEALQGAVIEVHCRCPLPEAARRFKARGESGHLHPAHPFALVPSNFFDEFDCPMGVSTVIEVDTTRPVDIDGLAAQLKALWSGEPQAAGGSDSPGQ